jgi:hypothetical protein
LPKEKARIIATGGRVMSTRVKGAPHVRLAPRRRPLRGRNEISPPSPHPYFRSSLARHACG